MIKRNHSENADCLDLNFKDLRWASFIGENLRFANLSYSNFTGANFTGAILAGAYIRGAVLSGANFTGADLSDANFRDTTLTNTCLADANLNGTIGNMKEIKSIFIDKYPVTYTADILQIGCERHRINDWWKFYDEEINSMDDGALEWWGKYKSIIKETIELSPAIETGHEGVESGRYCYRCSWQTYQGIVRSGGSDE